MRKLDDMKNQMNKEQMATFNIIENKVLESENDYTLTFQEDGPTSTISNSTSSSSILQQPPLFMFLSGEGGTGKSFIIKAVEILVRTTYGKTLGDWGPVLIIAPTGNSAHNIGGSTWQSKTGKNMTLKQFKATTTLQPETIIDLAKRAIGCRFVIFDEIS